MSTVKAIYDETHGVVSVEDAGLSVVVAAGTPGCKTLIAGAIAARMGAVVGDYCLRHNLNPAGLAVELDYTLEDGQMAALQAFISLPNADCHKCLTALEEIAAQCVISAAPVTVTIIDRSALREKALGFSTQKAVVVDDEARGIKKA
jgi:hypothetical protein